MILTLLYGSSGLLIIFSLLVLREARMLRRNTLLEKQAEEFWIRSEVERAGRQLDSTDIWQIVAACQTLYALEYPVRPAITGKLIRLSTSPNPRLAAYASAAYTRVELATKKEVERASAA
jgi:hypothetical protein